MTWTALAITSRGASHLWGLGAFTQLLLVSRYTPWKAPGASGGFGMRVLRWILIGWNMFGLGSMALLAPQLTLDRNSLLYMNTQALVQVGFWSTFYALSLIFLWKARPAPRISN